MGLIIRHSELKDIAGLQQLYSLPNAYSGTLQLPNPSLESWHKRISAIPEGVYSYVAEVDDVIAGNLGLRVEANPRRRHVASLGMAVHDDFLRKGIGSQLLCTALDLADNWLNIHRIELTVYIDNVSAIALYKKFGFILEGQSKDYAFRGGEFVDVYQMSRIKSKI
jgi:putative acetyltransferase